MKKYPLPNINYAPETVILANGTFPNHEIPLSILQKAKCLICCDGAINELRNRNITPSAIVGDCDSLSKENLILYKDIIYKNPDQETNDLTKAVQYCINNKVTKITIIGATGKREDHTLGNISLLGEYIDIIDTEIITDYGIFRCITTESKFESYPQEQVSIFSLEHSVLSTFGLKYEIKNRIFTKWWQGTLNEAVNSNFVIKTDAKTIIYQLF